ncbi:MAG: CRISPR-associated protein Cas5 [Thermoplasmata archaeon]
MFPGDGKILRFRLWGQFAHFNQTISNRIKNTYSIIPRTHLLGIIGAVLGYSGYINNSNEPEYYRMLKDLKVGISLRYGIAKRFLVEYNSLASYFNNRKDGDCNTIIHEQVIMNPDYEIAVAIDEENHDHKKLLEYVKNRQSVFHLYLGKNEFFASIEFTALEQYHINTKNIICTDYIFPFEELDEEPQVEHSLKVEILPVDFNEHFKYISKLMLIPECEKHKSKLKKYKIKNPNNFITAGDKEPKEYYLF